MDTSNQLATCDDCRAPVAPVHLFRLRDLRLCCVCYERHTITVPVSTPRKRHHAPHGPRPGKGLPTGYNS